MKLQEQKEAFIKLRAEGKSYRAIAKELGIAKTTANKWGQDLETEIAELKQEQLRALYDAYYMSKEARIQRLGDALARIDTALGQVDLLAISPERLLYYKLQYTQALKEEYTQPSNISLQGCTPKDILKAYSSLYKRVQAGEITAEQANRESSILSNMLKAYDTQVLQEKVEALETMLKRG